MKSSADLLSFDQYRRSKQPEGGLGRLARHNQIFHDRYKVIRPLGRGGFGVTYLAQDVSLPGSPLCVIKQLSPKVNSEKILAKACERFEREAKTLSQLGSHSQIPRLLNYFGGEGEFYLVQEYIKGDNLAKEVKLRGALSEGDVRQFLLEILPVLEYVHQHRVIHRDIKPPNIIRCKRDSRLVLIDFGAVKEQFAQVESQTGLAVSTQFVGTVGFAPPEQLALRPSFSSDIYSLGLTCVYLLTGRPPLELDYDPTTGEVSWHEFVQLSDYFNQILTKMVRVNPRDRYQSVRELKRALELEPHINELANCMSSQPPKPCDNDDDCEPSDGYISPIARTARSIRSWKNRIRSKGQTQSLKSDLCPHSGYLH